MSRQRLSPGALRHRITIQTGARTADGRGGFTVSWSTHAAVFANVQPASSREAFEQGQLQGSRSHVVTLRFIEGVQPRMRIVWGDRTLQITGVRTEGEDRRVLLLDCVEERI